MSQLDADAQAVVDQIAAVGLVPLPTLSPQNARMQPDVAQAAMGVLGSKVTARVTTPFPEPVGAVAHQTIPSNGRDVIVRIYTPQGAGPFPVLVYTHGGGFVIFDLDTYDSTCRALCNAAACVVVSVGYHQAPEHPFPAATDDAFAAYRWVLQNAPSINGDPLRVAVGGESAGGNLATVTAMRARDEGVPLPIFQLLVYPMADATNFTTPSYQAHANAKPLDKAMMQWFWGYYLPNEADRTNPYASPLQATDLSGLPPAMVITAEVDPLHSEGEAYARRLQHAGVSVVHKHYTGVMHEFFSMPAVIDTAKQAVNDAAGELQRAFAARERAGS